MSPTNWNRSCMQDILAQLRTNSTKPPGVKAVADDILICTGKETGKKKRFMIMIRSYTNSDTHMLQ